jgi:hypothetical protein
MRLSNLPIQLNNAELELDALLAPHGSRQPETLSHALDVCRHCRIIAIAELMLSGRAERFHRLLIQSATHYLAFLQQPGRRLSGRIEPLCDAIVSGEMELAQSLARTWGTDWAADEEYEEDHLHAMLLTRHLAGVPIDRDESLLLARFRGLESDRPEPRIGLWSGLLTQDVAAFESSLEDMLAQYERNQSRAVRGGQLSEAEQLTTARLNIEGLAFIYLGRRRGFTLQADYLLAPSLAQAAP